MVAYRAIILGGSGNVGSRVVSECIKSDTFSQITLISRRPLPEYDADDCKSKVTVRIIPAFETMDAENFEHHDVAFMLMGVGATSKASKEELERIDCTIPVAFASACKRSGVEHFSVLSSLGADASQEYSWLTRTSAGG